jgi:hypothetical protein
VLVVGGCWWLAVGGWGCGYGYGIEQQHKAARQA